MRFWQLRGNFCGSWPKNFQSSSEKWKNNTFPDKNYPSNYCFRKEKKKNVFPLKKSFRPKTFRQKSEKKFAHCPKVKIWKKKFQQRPFSSKYSNGQVECKFEIQARTVSTQSNLFSFNIRQWQKIIIFVNKNVFPQNVPLGMQNSVLTTPLTNFLKKPWKTSLKIRKDKKVTMFHYILLKPFFYTGRMQF